MKKKAQSEKSEIHLFLTSSMAEEGGNLKLVNDSLTKARKYSEEKNYGRAFAHYLVVFQLLPPAARKEYEREFTDVLHLWGTTLHYREKFEDVFRCYHLATTYFPNNVEIINNVGVHTLKLQNFLSAKSYFENCRNIDPNYLPAEQNLQTTKYALVERWHFPMLNDVIRNKCYARAIFLEISHGFTNILDIGTGTGLLSLFASKSKQCRSIVACDYSDTMFDIATKVFQANNVRNVTLVKKSSTLLSIPEDFKRKATLLVTEILDSGVFGENILETLIHAWDHLLTPFPYGKVIPAGVSIYVTGIQCDEISVKVRLIPRENNILKINQFCMMHTSDPYDTENLRCVNVTYVTETNKALHVNFNNALHLKMLYETEDHKTPATLKCKQNARIDTFAVWFTLHLNETVSITTDPHCPNKSCWDQAVQHLRHPLEVKENEEISIKLSCYDGYLEIDCPKANIIRHEENTTCYIVPRSTILFLNDFFLMNCLEQVSKILFERYGDMSDFTVLDTTPFPILGLLLMQHGAHLTYCVRDSFVKSAIVDMCRFNDIDSSRIQFVAESEFNEFTNQEMSWDVVFQNMVTPCGLLAENEVYQICVMKMSLTTRGVYLPQRVNVWAQLVQCEWLDQVTKVDDKNCCGFKIAQFMNEYKSAEQRDMNFSTTPHTALTTPVNLGCIVQDLHNVHEFVSHPTAVIAGRANAVFYWFEVELLDNLTVDTRRSNAFAAHSSFMLDTCVSVTEGAAVPLVLKQHKGLLKIYVQGTV